MLRSCLRVSMGNEEVRSGEARALHIRSQRHFILHHLLCRHPKSTLAEHNSTSTGLVDLVLDQPAPSLDSDPTPAKPAHRALDINLIGVYTSTYLALHYFRLPSASGTQPFKKSLILISSLTGYMDLPYNTGYATSKYAVRGMFRSIRRAVDKVNARVNNIAPGYVLTPLTKKVHQIDDPKQPSKATGHVLPWTPIEFVVDACGKCAVDEDIDGEFSVG